MTKLLLSSISALVLFGAFAGEAIAEAGVGGTVVNDTIPYEHWALPSTMRSAQVSPDGKYVAFIRNQSKKGEPLIEVYETANMKKKPHRVGAKSLEITGFSWISPTDMTVSFQKQVSSRIKGFNQGAFKGKLARFSMDSKKFEELSDDDFSITMVNALVDDPDHVLMRIVEVKEQQSRKAPNYYKYNLDTGSKKLILKGNRQHSGYTFDKDGNPRLTSSQTAGGKETIFYHRPVGGEGWNEFARVSRETFQRFRPVGLVEGSEKSSRTWFIDVKMSTLRMSDITPIVGNSLAKLQILVILVPSVIASLWIVKRKLSMTNLKRRYQMRIKSQ